MRLVFGALCLLAMLQAPGSPTPGRGQVAIYRDTWGVPHVYAQTDRDALFGVGYAAAADNLPSMLRTYLALRGESASVLGPENVDWDFHLLQWRYLEEAREGFKRLDARHQELHRAFLDGIRSYMKAHPAEVPAWAPPLEDALPLARGFLDAKAISVTSYRQGNGDCAATTGRAPGPSLDEATGFQASNQWAIGPGRTASGAAVLWSDSHSSFAFGREEVRIHADRLHVSGVRATGSPLPFVGHTRGVAWGVTVGGPDVSDCYEIDVDPANPTRYLRDRQPQEIRSVTHTVKVKDGAPVTRTFEYVTINGIVSPVVSRRDGKLYAVVTSYGDRADAYDRALLRLNTARDVDDLLAALADGGYEPENIMAADTKGNTLYLAAGRVPIRPKGFAWDRPVSGNTSETQWTGFHPVTQLVQLRNPAAGFMQNNNVAPDTLVPGGTPFDGPDYVFNDVRGRTNPRGERAIEMLAGLSRATTDDLLRAGMDSKWIRVERWRLALAQALKETTPTLSDAARQLWTSIETFDGYARRDSIAATHYLAWRKGVLATLLEEKRDARGLMMRIERQQPPTPEDLPVLVKGLARGAALLLEGMGRLDVPVGALYRVGAEDRSLPVDGGVMAAGSAEVPIRGNSCQQPPTVIKPCSVTAGQRHPFLAVMTSPITSFSALSSGQSGRPDSPHRWDQATLLSDATLKPTWFEWDQLKDHIASRLVLNTR